MAICRFSNTFGMYDVTPVENLFIDEFMLRAPGEHVKVYLYGLKCCYQGGGDASPVAIGAALGMEETAVTAAFSYWERQGLLRRLPGGEGFEYYNLKDVLFNQGLHPDPLLSAYAELNGQLEALFEERMLLPQDYQKIYDWIEVFGLSQEAALELVRHGIARHSKGRRVPISYLDRIAQTWAGEGITSLEAARERAREEEARQLGLSKVLARLGQKRSATAFEQELFLKWTRQWGFDLPAILEACRETLKATNPSFAYVDKVLENYHRQGLTDVAAIEGARQDQADRDEPVKAWLKALGLRGAVNDAHRRIYESYTAQGIQDETLLAMAAYSQKLGRTSPADQESLLARWLEMGIQTPEQWRDYITEQQRLSTLAGQVLRAAGEDRPVSPSDQGLYRKWEGMGFPQQSVLLAAEYARGSRNPMTFINRILENWHAQGAHDPEAAAREHAARLNRGKPQDHKQFSQRSYTEEDLKHLYVDYEKM